MPVLDAQTDTENLTLTIVSEIATTPERAWQLWADARQLEQWWGPPTWPATFARHDLTPGGESRYFMTGPDGTKAHGWWTTVETAEPGRLVFKDGFSGDDGEPTDPADHVTGTVTIAAMGDRTRMTVQTHFQSAEQLRSMTEMGMAEGMSQAMGQIGPDRREPPTAARHLSYGAAVGVRPGGSGPRRAGRGLRWQGTAHPRTTAEV